MSAAAEIRQEARRTCARCGSRFEAKRRDARYCSNRCRAAASRERRRAGTEGMRALPLVLDEATLARLVQFDLIPAEATENDETLARVLSDLTDLIALPEVAAVLRVLLERMAADQFGVEADALDVLGLSMFRL